MLRTKLFLFVVALSSLSASIAAADPIRGSIADAYRGNRKALNQSENFYEDRLRAEENAILDRQRDAWLANRRSVPPQVRVQMDRQYAAQRKATILHFQSDRTQLRAQYNNTRDALHNDYRQSLRQYDTVRRTGSYPVYAPPVIWSAPRVESWSPIVPTPNYVDPREEVFGIPQRGVEF